jgi:fructose-bisphosphate aldolase, class I
MASQKIIDLLGDKASFLLDHKPVLDKTVLSAFPSPRHVDEIWTNSNRSNRVLSSIQTLIGHGRLADTGYLSIFPVDQGIEHSGGASFAANPMYFDPENIIKLAIEAGCNAVASTFGVLGIMSRKYAHRIPFVVKINHNEFLSLPNRYDQTLFGSVKDAWNMGAAWLQSCGAIPAIKAS